jgi:hypothetical protein
MLYLVDNDSVAKCHLNLPRLFCPLAFTVIGGQYVLLQRLANNPCYCQKCWSFCYFSCCAGSKRGIVCVKPGYRPINLMDNELSASRYVLQLSAQ